MATPLDATLLQDFSSIFVFLFIVIIIYAVMRYSKVFGGKDWIGILIGVIIGILTLLSPVATESIKTMAPWFVVIFIFLVLAMVLFSLIGASDATPAIGSLKGVVLVIIVITIVIGILIQAREQIPEKSKEDYAKSSTLFFFHPKVLGTIVILLIAVFTVALIAGKPR